MLFPDVLAEAHAQWPIDRDDEESLSAFIAACGPLPVDIAAWQQMDADRSADLIDLPALAPVLDWLAALGDTA